MMTPNLGSGSKTDQRFLPLGTTWQHVLVIFATWFLEMGASLVIEKMLKVQSFDKSLVATS